MTTTTDNPLTERTQADIIYEQTVLLDSALDPIIVRDLEGNLIFWNKAAERLYGWTFEEAKSLTIHQPIATEDHAKFDRGIKEFAEKGECAIELRQKAKNGRTIITHSRWSVARNREEIPMADSLLLVILQNSGTSKLSFAVRSAWKV